MIFTFKDKDDFEKAEICWICQKEFGEREKKVRDHCHFTGKYRGAAHNKCNLQFKTPNFTPVIFHNLSGYDAHLFVKNLGKSEGNIKCIPKEFGVKNLGEYHDLYLKSDVLLLTDVFEEFRNVCLKNYSLDPAWYYTSPGLSWDALLKHSGVKLELLTDPDILLLFEKE